MDIRSLIYKQGNKGLEGLSWATQGSRGQVSSHPALQCSWYTTLRLHFLPQSGVACARLDHSALGKLRIHEINVIFWYLLVILQ